MSIDRRFPKWRDAEVLDLWVPVGTGTPWFDPGHPRYRPPSRRAFLARGPEFGIGSSDFYSTPLDLDDFVTGPSDYDMPSDEVYCPCGATLPGWDGSAGTLLRMIYQHCGASGHPRPVFDR